MKTKLHRLQNKYRVWKLKMQGCKIGKNCIIGRRVTIIGKANIQLGDNIIIEDNVRIKVNNYSNSENKHQLVIHNNVFIGYGCVIDANIMVEIHDYCMFGPYCFITDSNHVHHLNDDIFPFLGGKYKNVVIKENCWLGAYCIVLPGVIINKNSIIAANSVVLKNVQSNSLNTGSPTVEKKRN